MRLSEATATHLEQVWNANQPHWVGRLAASATIRPRMPYRPRPEAAMPRPAVMAAMRNTYTQRTVKGCRLDEREIVEE